ncbi:MAG TPA: helix-turn-helix transcriptional regulator [Pseudobdellovibrionaceae bacterium]|mgnify:FL=1|nr:helix-turn-helix transcriptional regulator [Pseudobdellovibrionaceae bacterium]
MKYKNITPARPYLDKKLKDKTIKIFFDEEKTKTEIARLIRTAREAAGFSQREIALKADTTQAVVARLELGTDKRMPSLMLIVRLLKAANAHLELTCIFDKVA